MRHRLGMLLLTSAAMIVPAAAQQGQPNPNQAAAKTILQAADAAIGASKVNSFIATGSGRRGYPGQQFSEGDLPQTDTKGNVRTVDFASKSAKTEYTRVQGNNIPRGGGAGFPVQGEQKFVEVVNGSTGWNVNAQGQPVRISGHRRRGSPARPLDQPDRLHQGWPGGPQCGGHRPVLRPGKPHPQSRRLYGQSLRWAATAMHPPGDRRVQ